MDEQQYAFKLNQQRMIYESKFTGFRDNCKNIIGLELEGIEDILEYLSPEAASSIQERVDRIRQYIDEMCNE